MSGIKVSSILLVSYYCPTKAHAGGQRILDIYYFLKGQNKEIKIDLLTHSRPSIDWDVGYLDELFDNVFYSKTEKLTPYTIVESRGKFARYDLIDMQFHEAGIDIDSFRIIGNRIIYTPMESMVKVAYYASIVNRDRVINGNHLLDFNVYKRAMEELDIINKSDLTVCVSKSDASLLRALTRLNKIKYVDTCLSNIEFGNIIKKFQLTMAGDRKCNVLYVAYFGSQTNLDALDWYLSSVHPIVKNNVPEYSLTIVGRGDLSKYKMMGDSSIEIVGEVEVLSPQIKTARLGIAPALSGGGFRGKINQYSIFGIPTVATKIAATGLKYTHGKDIFIEDDPVVFARYCIMLLKDWGLNESMGSKAREVCEKNYVWSAKWKDIAKIYGLQYRKLVRTPLITILVPSYNHSKFIIERIESIYNQTYKNFEVFVIDDCSQDSSVSELKKIQKLYDFKLIVNDVNSGSPFSSWESILDMSNGEYVWICESDDVAESNFLRNAVLSFNQNPSAVLFYSHSKIIDSDGSVIGDTRKYFHDVFKSDRWDASFVSDGKYELEQFQIYGQTVPNMSSAVINFDVFKDSYTKFIKKLKLTGDWYFIAAVMTYGKVIFSNQFLSNFREHPITSRVRVKSAQSQAEFIITKIKMFELLRKNDCSISMIDVFKNDLIRFIFEPATWLEVCRNMSKLSFEDEIKFFDGVLQEINRNQELILELSELYRHSYHVNANKNYNNL